MRIGLVYDLFDDYPWRAGDPPDADAEYEPAETVEVLEGALALLGHESVRIGTARALLTQLGSLRVDAVINIAEGIRGRNREGEVPTLLEMAGIPFLGSDALTLSLSLDKAWTKDLAVAAGVPTPAYRTYRRSTEIDAALLPGPFPLFVKPRYEGTAKGITPASRVDDVGSLRTQVDRVGDAYGQDAIVEPFVAGGGEFTVAVIGNDPPEALPVLQRAVEKKTRIGLHALEKRGMPENAFEYEIEGSLDAALERGLQDLAIRVYDKLLCRDFARIDFRVDAHGRPWFIEINPLPTFAPDGTFAIIAELTGRSYEAFLADVLGRAFARIGLTTRGAGLQNE
jgi:D-alanine-D-alanine ligase